MMRLTRRDGLATLFVAAAAALYALWLTETAMAGISARVLGVVVFGLGWAACTVNQAEMAVVYGAGTRRRAPIAYVVIASLVGGIALLTGVMTLASGNRAILAALVIATIALWAMATVRHLIANGTRANDHAVREPLDKAA